MTKNWRAAIILKTGTPSHMDYDELLEYCRKKFKNWDKPKSETGPREKGKKKKR